MVSALIETGSGTFAAADDSFAALMNDAEIGPLRMGYASGLLACERVGTRACGYTSVFATPR